MKRILPLVLASTLASTLVSGLATAQPKTAEDWYKEGATQYNLGNFDQAADAFKQGFALEPDENKKPAYLYNVAQAYRQENKCKEAVFFYKRFVALSTNLKPSTRAKVENLIKEGEDCEAKQQALAAQPPQNTLHPGSGSAAGDDDGTGSDAAAGSNAGSAAGSGAGAGAGSNTRVADRADGDAGDDDDTGTRITKTLPPPAAPKVLSARLLGGAAITSAGSLSFPVEPSFTLIAGYPLQLADKLELDVGAAVGYTPVPFTNSITDKQSSASFVTALADAGVTYQVAPKIGVRGDLGVGALVFGGLEEMGNPFTVGGAPASGALTMFAARLGVSGDYAITKNLLATLAPAVTYSPPKDGLTTDIKAILRIDLMVGLGYRM